MTSRQDNLATTIRASGISDDRLLEAFHDIPRAGFVPPAARLLAYEDQPLPIPHDQVTTQPSLSARMIEALDLTVSDQVLEVGTGLGFQTALLARLAAEVVSVERHPDLASQARENLNRHGIANVRVMVGDGSLGAPEFAPFDAVLVSAAFPTVPAPLVEQMCDGGRLVQPIGPGGSEKVTLFVKDGGDLTRVRAIIPARFVRLVGEKGFPQ